MREPARASTGGPAPAASSDDAGEQVADEAASEVPALPSWPDETVESAFRAEALERGEAMTVAKPAVEMAEETEAAPLPALDSLVQRIPPHVRETLDDLFRARFVAVKRVPERALKR